MLPDSFQPYYLLKTTTGLVNIATSGSTNLLDNTPGLVGIYPTPLATGVYGTATAAGTATPCVIGVGSWHTTDSISPLWKGLKEPEFTQIIDWKKVIDFAKTTGVAAQNQVVNFGWSQSSASTTGPLFNCGVTYNLYLEAQGNPALNFLNHQFYKQLSAVGGCCTTDCTSGCTSAYVDAACVMLQWKDAINQDPYWPSFISPAVYVKNGATKTQVYSAYDVTQDSDLSEYTCNTSDPSSVIACLEITVAYAQTTFNTCTFSPTDYYEVEPLIIANVSLVNQDASPCAVNTTINSSVPNLFNQITAPLQTRGIGQQVVRNLIEWGRYRQEYFPDSLSSVDMLRMREIENFTELTNVDLSGIYDSIILRFNQTRPWNYSSITDQDAYCLTFYVPTGTSTTAFTALIDACLTAAGNSVQLRTI